MLCHCVERSALLKDCVIALDGFTGFTPVQNQLLEKLLRTAGQIWVTVTLDERENPMYLGADHQLFYLSKKMCIRDRLCNHGCGEKTEIRLCGYS